MMDRLYVSGKIGIFIYAPGAHGPATTMGSLLEVASPIAMDFDRNSNLYVSDSGFDNVLEFDPNEAPLGAPLAKFGSGGGAFAVDDFGIVYTVPDLAPQDLVDFPATDSVVSVYAPSTSGYVLALKFKLALQGFVQAMAVNKSKRIGPPRVRGLVPSLVATLMTAGVPRGGGGVVVVGGIPIPVGPWGETSGPEMAARRDLLIGMAIEQLASEVGDKAGQNAIRRAALELVKAKADQLLASLD